MRIRLRLMVVVFSIIASVSKAQIVTSEDSLASGLLPAKTSTVLSGYGEATASYDLQEKDGQADLKRIVLFVGHKFNNRISLFTELELESAVVAGGEEKGEIAMEQAFLKMNIDPSHYFVAGLFLPRIGIINENHLPTTYSSVERPWVEQLVIPSTWRELGIGFYGSSNRIRGIHYSVSITNGLNAAAFESGSGIRGGRQEGSQAKWAGLAANASLLYYVNHFRLQTSMYFGGSTAMRASLADSLGVNHGLLANPVQLNEFNIQYHNNRLMAKALFCYITVHDAENINRVFANNTPHSIVGSYAELGYDVLPKSLQKEGRSITLFSRGELINTNQVVAENGIENLANKQLLVVSGVNYKPIRGVVMKLDYTWKQTGKQNPLLAQQNLPYFTNRGIVSVGIGYNF
ncbi:MAG: hypothetical protein RIQ62_18 [Bacteroidota bacterium]